MKTRYYKDKFMIALVETDELALIRYLADNVRELAKLIPHGYDVIQSTISHHHEFMLVRGERLRIEFIPIETIENTQGGRTNE